MNRKNISSHLLAFALGIAAGVAFTPCNAITSNTVEPRPEPDALDESGPADPDSTGAP